MSTKQNKTDRRLATRMPRARVYVCESKKRPTPTTPTTPALGVAGVAGVGKKLN